MLEIPPTPGKFPVGTTVRAKLGTMDPDFPDIPIGGWAGKIQEINQQINPPAYLVHWNQHTLDQMNPVRSTRCEQEGLDLESMWLDEDDLEMDTSAIAKTEQPVAFIPLSQEDHEENTAPDFLAGMPFDFSSSFPKKRISFTAALALVVVLGMVIGTVLGSLLASMETARTLAAFGATILGFLGFFTGSRFGMIFGRMQQMVLGRPIKRKSGSLWGGILGAVVGGLAGALAGAMAMAILGLLTGSLVGALISNLVLRGRRKRSFIFLGSMIGATVQAFLLDQEQALVGAIYGGTIGAAAAFMAIIGLKILTARNRGR